MRSHLPKVLRNHGAAHQVRQHCHVPLVPAIAAMQASVAGYESGYGYCLSPYSTAYRRALRIRTRIRTRIRIRLPSRRCKHPTLPSLPKNIGPSEADIPIGDFVSIAEQPALATHIALHLKHRIASRWSRRHILLKHLGPCCTYNHS